MGEFLVVIIDFFGQAVSYTFCQSFVTLVVVGVELFEFSQHLAQRGVEVAALVDVVDIRVAEAVAGLVVADAVWDH